MIRKKEEIRIESLFNELGGRGELQLEHFLSDREMRSKCRLCSLARLLPGASVGFHPHDNEEEIYIITKGTGIVNDNGNIAEIEAGDCILTGNGDSHSIQNIGEEDLEFIAVIVGF